MIHLRDGEDRRNQGLNSEAVTLCGIVGKLPDGDKFHYLSEGCAQYVADCPGCNPNPRQFGTPISQLRGRPDGTPEGQAGYERFRDIAASWGYD